MTKKYITRLGKGGKVYVTRMKPGSDLLQSICSLVEDNRTKASVILSGLGLLRRARLRNCKTLPEKYPITDANRSFLIFERPLEILALSGNVSEVEGKAWVHAHITLSYVEGEEIRVVGGHLLEGCIIFGFAEVFVMELKDIDMKKTLDAETKTLQLFVK
ncbi:MAG: PPC domain-containing DNA-binding protein [Candidatus Heimdallarchaeota archaeon]